MEDDEGDVEECRMVMGVCMRSGASIIISSSSNSGQPKCPIKGKGGKSGRLSIIYLNKKQKRQPVEGGCVPRKQQSGSKLGRQQANDEQQGFQSKPREGGKAKHRHSKSDNDLVSSIL